MIIYTITATFGKLEHETLTLQPGLNVIQAPNEWGKSTWCAFLLNMLYGVDTKEREKQGVLPDKERYAPWSGAAMSGRIELNWNGRDITIERSSTPRIPLGVFRAYETATGMDIPELTAANCGQMLLGVERSVFTQAGFLRLNDMPVVQDEALRRRLNNLVTTGDESGSADKLNQSLRDLKNKCRSNKVNGLLPEAEAQRDQLRNQLWDLQSLTSQTQQLQERQKKLEGLLQKLENHQDALSYQASLKDAAKVQLAQLAAQTAQEQAKHLEQTTGQLPPEAEARAALQTADRLQFQADNLDAQEKRLPPEPQHPQIPASCEGFTPERAIQAAKEDLTACDELEMRQKSCPRRVTAFCVLGVLLCFALAVIRFVVQLTEPYIYLIGGGCIAAGGVAVLVINALQTKKFRDNIQAIYDRHPGQPLKDWIPTAQAYAANMADYNEAVQKYHLQISSYTQQRTQLEQQLQDFAPNTTLSQQRRFYENVVEQWEQLALAQKDAAQAQQHADALAAMVKPVEPPKAEDDLEYTQEQTQERLAAITFELRQTQQQLDQCTGRISAMGQPAAIQAELDEVNRRIARLETYYSAIEMAQDALFKATVALQRRFAPRITKRTQELFSKLTAGRYQRLTMSEDMSLQVAAEQEDVLRQLRRRSDGTIDQLYLALRLAVAEELTPQAPMVLDDALVRFDDTRLAVAMDILKETAQKKQVILFTCQSRESGA